MLREPNVLIAFVGSAGFLVMALSLLAHPRYSLARELARLEGEEGIEERSLVARLQRTLKQANIPISAPEFLRVSLVLGIVIGGAGLLLTGAPVLGVLGFLGGSALYWMHLSDRRDKARIAYQEALLGVIQILQETFAATGSLPMALDAVAEHAPPAARPDFEEIRNRYHVGESLPEVLQEVADRRREVMMDQLVEALIAHSQEGGELGPVLNAVGQAARGMSRVRQKVNSSMVKIIWEARIVCVAPFVFMVILRFTAPALQGPFYASLWGQIALVAVVALCVMAYYFMNRMGRKALAVIESMGVRA